MKNLIIGIMLGWVPLLLMSITYVYYRDKQWQRYRTSDQARQRGKRGLLGVWWRWLATGVIQ